MLVKGALIAKLDCFQFWECWHTLNPTGFIFFFFNKTELFNVAYLQLVTFMRLAGYMYFAGLLVWLCLITAFYSNNVAATS